MLVSNVLTTALFSLLATTALADRPCGFKIAPCPTGQTCSHVDDTCTRGENCAGVCQDAPATAMATYTAVEPTPTHQSCGGLRPKPAPCPEGQICIDDPYGSGCGMACDGPGICVTPTFCGGYANVQCEDGKKCFDDPTDDCGPEDGGYDCGGICV